MWITFPHTFCRLGLSQDSDFGRDLEDSKSTSGGTLCIFGSHTFVPISWMCKKQTSVSHSSTESEIISLDAGLRLDGLPALDLWDLIVAVLGNVSRVSDRTRKPESDVYKRHKSQKKIDVMEDIDFVPSNVQSACQEALLYVFEDNEAVIKMIMKGRSLTMRHVSRTHRVALDWLFDRINMDSKIQIKYVDTKNQLADLLTKGSFTRDEWKHLLRASGEGSAIAKPRSMNLVAAKPRPTNWMSHNLLSARKNSSQDLSDSNNQWDAKAEQGGVSTCVWKQMRDTSRNPAEYSQVRQRSTGYLCSQFFFWGEGVN